MTPQQIPLFIFSFLPFAVCLAWLMRFVMRYRQCDAPRHYFMAYLLTCVVLYLCHAFYFTAGLPYAFECVWTLCSLSVYPLFYGYLCRLTSSGYSRRQLLPWLVPGVVVALAKYALPDAGIDRVRVLLFMVQIAGVCYFGIRKLKAFDRELQAIYADTEGRDTTAVHHLFLAIITVCILSGIANSIGKQFFGESLWLLIPISLAFSTMQFALSHICFHKDFTIDQLLLDQRDEEPIASPLSSPQPDGIDLLGQRLETLMVEQHYFLKKDLKIGDVVRQINSNRTYVSNYINRTYQCSFSDYMNRLRVEYAQQLLTSTPGSSKMAAIAEAAGFASEQSFYRNFKKFTGMTPIEWANCQSCPSTETTSSSPA